MILGDGRTVGFTKPIGPFGTTGRVDFTCTNPGFQCLLERFDIRVVEQRLVQLFHSITPFVDLVQGDHNEG